MPKGTKTINKGVKATKAIKERRIAEAGEWILANPVAGYQKFMDYWCPRWNIQRDAALKYKKWAEERVGKEFNENVNLEKRKAISKWQKLYDLAMKQDNLSEAVKIAAHIDKITGALAPIKTEVVQKQDADIFKINLEEPKLKKVD